MSGAGITTPTRVGGAVFALALAAFLVGHHVMAVHQTILAIPAAIGWAGALYALRPMVREDRKSALYFAFGVMAFLIFFLHETYEFQGKVRYFPLIVGWTGIALSVLDILGLTETRLAHRINTIFAGAIETPAGEGRKAGREIACFLAMLFGLALIWLFGFLVATPLFVFLWMRVWGGKSLRSSFYGGVFTLAFVWVLFEGLLQYELYRGEVVMWLMDKIQP